ncbi:unnamed protein product, partial [Meganyctiphanes norvegica]
LLGATAPEKNRMMLLPVIMLAYFASHAVLAVPVADPAPVPDPKADPEPEFQPHHSPAMASQFQPHHSPAMGAQFQPHHSPMMAGGLSPHHLQRLLLHILPLLQG